MLATQITRRVLERSALVVCAVVLASGCVSSSSRPHEALQATLWVQHAAEYEATTRQLYRLAQERLDVALADPSWSALDQDPAEVGALPPAIILDVDETVLDNSAFQARLVLDGGIFTERSWDEWVRAAQAPAMPGAVELLEHAVARGVEVFYVTNRHAEHEPATRANLSAAGLPVSAELDVVLTIGENGWTENKESRRQRIASTHRVLLLLGDDLNDFVPARGVGAEARAQLVAQNQHRWGVSWILLPNQTYGSWDATLTGSVAGRRNVLRHKRALLRSFGEG